MTKKSINGRREFGPDDMSCKDTFVAGKGFKKELKVGAQSLEPIKITTVDLRLVVVSEMSL